MDYFEIILLVVIILLFVIQILTLFKIKNTDTKTISELNEVYKRFSDVQEQLSFLIQGYAKVNEYITGEKSSPVLKGQKFQEVIFNELLGAYPEDKIEFTANTPYKGDIVIYPRVKTPTGAIVESSIPIVIDAKEYTTRLPREQIDKLFRDLDALNSPFGILVVSDDAAITSYPSRYISRANKTIFLASYQGKGHITIYAAIRAALTLLSMNGTDIRKLADSISQSGIIQTILSLEKLSEEISKSIDSWNRRLTNLRNEILRKISELKTAIQSIEDQNDIRKSQN
ncbi:MAG: hypothetical protein ACTSSP_09275 [Candidatus Asgardarchaeia archaeon]|nr:hypothetical protein [Candidatus Odinarchaeota archaeon]